MNHLSHPYRHFDPVARFVYLNNPQQIAATIETAKPGEITTAVTADNLKAAIDKAQTAIKKGSEDLAKTLGRDATTGREKDALNALNALEKESAAKFRELIDAHGVAVSDASADKQTKLETVKGNLDAAISALVTKIHATTDEGANDELDDAQKKIAYTVLVNQIPEFGKKKPAEGTPQYKALMAIIATITPEQLNGLTEKSDSIPLRPKQGEDAMEKTFDGKLPKEKPEVKEGKTKALTKFITEKDIGTTKQIPDAACEAVVKYLATRYEVTQEAADKPLKIDGTEIRDMDALMPKLDGLKGSDQKLPTNLTEAAQKGTATTEQLGHIRDYLKQVKAEGDEKPKGWMDNIGELFSAITQLIAAWKSQDFDTLGDVAKDLQAGKNPLEEQQKASDTYRTILEHRSPAPNLNAMLAAYANPRGAEAKNLFGSKNTRLNDAQANTPNSETRYRTAAKEAIKKHLEDKLGVAIDENSVSRGTNGAMRLTYQKDDVKYRLDVSQGADRKIRVIKTTVGANGTETKNDAYDLTDIDAVNQFIAATDLNSFNANKVTLVATPAPAAAEAPPQQNQSRGRIAPAE